MSMGVCRTLWNSGDVVEEFFSSVSQECGSTERFCFGRGKQQKHRMKNIQYSVFFFNFSKNNETKEIQFKFNIYIYITQTLSSYTSTQSTRSWCFRTTESAFTFVVLYNKHLYGCTKSIDNPHIPTCIYSFTSTAYTYIYIYIYINIYITINNMNNYMVSFVVPGWRRRKSPPGKRVTSLARPSIGASEFSATSRPIAETVGFLIGLAVSTRATVVSVCIAIGTARTCVPCTIVRFRGGVVKRNRSDGLLPERVLGRRVTRTPKDISRHGRNGSCRSPCKRPGRTPFVGGPENNSTWSGRKQTVNDDRRCAGRLPFKTS